MISGDWVSACAIDKNICYDPKPSTSSLFQKLSILDWPTKFRDLSKPVTFYMLRSLEYLVLGIWCFPSFLQDANNISKWYLSCLVYHRPYFISLRDVHGSFFLDVSRYSTYACSKLKRCAWIHCFCKEWYFFGWCRLRISGRWLRTTIMATSFKRLSRCGQASGQVTAQQGHCHAIDKIKGHHHPTLKVFFYTVETLSIFDWAINLEIFKSTSFHPSKLATFYMLS